ncbi:MAG: TetR/AcrR family transcriptional regulator, partial [Bryobacteraceae bacterium]
MTEVINIPQSRRARKKASTRAQIVAAAIRLFSEQGIDAVTVDQIAAAADVGKGTIYNYFQTKEDI